MRNGWICLSRRLLDWQWHDEPNMVALWVYLLLRANYEPAKYRGVTVGVGELMTTLNKICAATGLTKNILRLCLQRLSSCGAITIKTTHNGSHDGSLISIVNYEQYQDQPETRKPHANHTQTTRKTSSISDDCEDDNEIDHTQTTRKPHAKPHANHTNKTNNNTSSSSSSREAVVVAPDLSIPPESVQAAAAQILSDPATQPLILLRAKMPLPDILNALPEFAAQCRLRNQGYKTPQHLAEHLANWLQKKHEYSQPAPTPTLNPNGRAAADPAATAAAEEERHRSVILRAYELMAGGN